MVHKQYLSLSVWRHNKKSILHISIPIVFINLVSENYICFILLLKTIFFWNNKFGYLINCNMMVKNSKTVKQSLLRQQTINAYGYSLILYQDKIH